jgi:DNA invertase Pin-like site-specific DNA recombinase
MSILVAQYVRMSTDLQRYSIDNQKVAIQQYALQHGFAVMKTYADHDQRFLQRNPRDVYS